MWALPANLHHHAGHEWLARQSVTPGMAGLRRRSHRVNRYGRLAGLTELIRPVLVIEPHVIIDALIVL